MFIEDISRNSVFVGVVGKSYHPDITHPKNDPRDDFSSRGGRGGENIEDAATGLLGQLGQIYVCYEIYTCTCT